ncbi:MAG: 23S rRNA (adenine(2503)-C(2))-methyltransferase RlmN [Candidatus Pacebacteria bacterium]|nr:23S rRNA (adenine(2503)-C(2))-methyltransferase RlmN [Candidatus Paceibacterota bacterium]
MNLQAIQKYLNKEGEPGFRLQQIQSGIYQKYCLSFEEIKGLPKNLAIKLEENFPIFPFKTVSVLSSEDKRAFKALLETKDRHKIETVLLSPQANTFSACLSSQAGCALNCKFCSTGKIGFSRNLSPKEISGQYLFWKNYFKKNNLPGNFSNIVFMGMGEPFLNWDNLKEAILELNNPKLYNLGSRHISISTSGISPKLKELAKTFPQINLAVSLIFPEQKQRELYMPVAKQYSLKNLKQAIENYLTITKRKVFLEYIVFSGLNDRQESITQLEKFVKSISDWQKLIQINLIAYNDNNLDKFISPQPEKIQKLKQELEKRRMKVTVRKSLGQDIQGACGQLAGNRTN